MSVLAKSCSVELVACIEETGFDFAFTTREGFATDDPPRLETSRFAVSAGSSANQPIHRRA